MTKRRFGEDGESLEKGWKWIGQRFRERPLSSLLVAAGMLALLAIVVNTVRLGGTGFEPKTLWDWMDLLLVPLVLAIGGWWLNKTQKDSEQRIAQERREQETLEQYFDRMTQLMVELGLRYPRKGNPELEFEVQTIARARTLSVMRTLNRIRKGVVIRFLYESGLIVWDARDSSSEPVIDIRHAELQGVDLRHSVLPNIWLYGTDMKRADLTRTNLQDANLHAVDLRDANLTSTYLVGTIMIRARLEGANLDTASLLGFPDHNLPGPILYDATYNSLTKWPDGFDPKAAGAILVDEDGNPIDEPNKGRIAPKDIKDD